MNEDHDLLFDVQSSPRETEQDNQGQNYIELYVLTRDKESVKDRIKISSDRLEEKLPYLKEIIADRFNEKGSVVKFVLSGRTVEDSVTMKELISTPTDATILVFFVKEVRETQQR
jgi:hypothetical protein